MPVVTIGGWVLVTAYVSLPLERGLWSTKAFCCQFSSLTNPCQSTLGRLMPRPKECPPKGKPKESFTKFLEHNALPITWAKPITPPTAPKRRSEIGHTAQHFGLTLLKG